MNMIIRIRRIRHTLASPIEFNDFFRQFCGVALHTKSGAHFLRTLFYCLDSRTSAPSNEILSQLSANSVGRTHRRWGHVFPASIHLHCVRMYLYMCGIYSLQVRGFSTQYTPFPFNCVFFVFALVHS